MSDGVRLCDECGEPIPAKRLKALPNTRLCVECAEDQERDKARYSQRSPSGIGAEFLDGAVEDLEEFIDG